jgi:hypothetical protein
MKLPLPSWVQRVLLTPGALEEMRVAVPLLQTARMLLAWPEAGARR